VNKVAVGHLFRRMVNGRYDRMMLSITHAIWRHVLTGARDERHIWPSLGDLASELQLNVSTVHKALRYPTEIGAVQVSRLGGVEILDPYRLLLMLAAGRRLQRDVLARRQLPVLPVAWLERAARDAGLVVGGIGGLVEHLGENQISTYRTVVVYGDERFGYDLAAAAPEENSVELLVLEPDPWLARGGLQTVPFAHAYADTFALPGWEAARFIEELDPWTVISRDERNLVA
jgi:hypothetical protein